MPASTLSHRARLEACLSGDKPDRVPVALWRHFPVDDQTPDGLAAATAAFQRALDYDLIKVTPSSSFCLKDWGVDDAWHANPEGTREYVRRAVLRPEDWERLPVLNPTTGRLGDQLACLRLLTDEFTPDTPVIQTIFSPLAQAKNLVGGDALLVHLRKYPQAVHAGLRSISESILRFVEACRLLPIAGFFYAVQHAQFGLLSTQEFDQFGRAYDLPILAAVQDYWLNMVHLHGNEVMFDRVADYPVQVINWHDRQTEPSLREAAGRFPGVLCGGLRQWETMVLGDPRIVESESRDAIQATGGRRFILGTGCVVPVIAPTANLQAARRVVEQAHPD